MTFAFSFAPDPPNTPRNNESFYLYQEKIGKCSMDFGLMDLSVAVRIPAGVRFLT